MLYLVFDIGDDRFLLRTSDVVRVVSNRRARPVPSAPAGLAGMLTFEGNVVPLIDPGVAIVGAASRHLRSTRIAYCHHHANEVTRVLGVVMECAVETIRLDESEFSPPPVSMERCRCAGDIATVGGRMMQRVEVAEMASEEVWQLVRNADTAKADA